VLAVPAGEGAHHVGRVDLIGARQRTQPGGLRPPRCRTSRPPRASPRRELTPTRIDNRGSPGRRLWRAIACCVATALATAPDVLGNATIRPSPRFLTTSPRWTSAASPSSAKCTRRTSSAASGRIERASSVEPTRFLACLWVIAEKVGRRARALLGFRVYYDEAVLRAVVWASGSKSPVPSTDMRVVRA
jgi:hypothetical protein